MDEKEKAIQAVTETATKAAEKVIAEKGADYIKSDEGKKEIKSIIDASFADFKVKHGDNDVTLQKAIDDLQKGFDAMAIKMQRGGGNVENVGQQIEKFLKDSNLKDWAKSKGAPLELETKAVVTMTVTNVAGGVTANPYLPAANVVPGVIQPARLTPVLQDYVNVGNTDSPSVVWMNKTPTQGGAAFIAEGTLKPSASFTIVPERADAKKVAVTFKVSTESLEDIPYLQTLIQQEGFYQLRYKIGTEVLSGPGGSNNNTTDLKGILGYAGGYVLTTVKGTAGQQVDNAAAILAAATQVKTQFFSADLAFANPIDVANMNIAKGSDGQYIIPPFMTADGMRVGGLTVIETNEIPVGRLLVIDSSKYHLLNYKGPRLEIGWENDDFTKNLRTIIVEQRLIAYVSANEVGAFVYDTFANIKAAILTPAA